MFAPFSRSLCILLVLAAAFVSRSAARLSGVEYTTTP
jgi:hypothetical protein